MSDISMTMANKPYFIRHYKIFQSRLAITYSFTKH